MRHHRDDTQLRLARSTLYSPPRQQSYRSRVRGKLWRIDLNGLPTQKPCKPLPAAYQGLRQQWIEVTRHGRSNAQPAAS